MFLGFMGHRVYGHNMGFGRMNPCAAMLFSCLDLLSEQ